jgi:molybdopterin converting factor small subunit
MATVTIRYWAAAKEAAGIAEEEVQADTLAQALDVALARRPVGSRPRLRQVLSRSSFLVDGMQVGSKTPAELVLHDRAVIEVLPGFAGG